MNATVIRSFCSNCGSPISITNSNWEGGISVPTGLMDGKEWQEEVEKLGPTMEFFAKNRCEWVPEIEGTKANMLQGMT